MSYELLQHHLRGSPFVQRPLGCLTYQRPLVSRLHLCASCLGRRLTQSGSTASTASTGLTGTPASGGTDYSVVANWVCRPGSDAVCTQGLDASIENANGSTTSQPFTAAADPPIDCFYVYAPRYLKRQPTMPISRTAPKSRP